MALYSSSDITGCSAQPPRRSANNETKSTKRIFIRGSYRCTESGAMASGKWLEGGPCPIPSFMDASFCSAQCRRGRPFITHICCLSGINDDRLSPAYRTYQPGTDFLNIPIWISGNAVIRRRRAIIASTHRIQAGARRTIHGRLPTEETRGAARVVLVPAARGILMN
jgi:hypothetical protein